MTCHGARSLGVCLARESPTSSLRLFQLTHAREGLKETMPPSSPSLETLPEPVQQRVVELALAQDPHFALIALTALGRSLHAATRSVLARTLTLDDDDSVLVAAEEWAEQARGGRGPSDSVSGERPASGVGAVKGSVLAQVVAKDDWADQVRELVVVRPTVDPAPIPSASSAHQFEQFSFDEDSPSTSRDDSDSPVPPLNDAALFGLIRRCKNLTSFIWSSHRLPPDHLCQVLGESAKALLHFKVDLSMSPFASAVGQGEEAGGVGAGSFVGSPSSPQLGTSPTTSFSSHGPGSTSQAAPRWDALSLSSLPSTLTSLAISSLSLAGSRSLCASLASFPSLESLNLSRTLFVDDAVLLSIGANCKALKRLEVREMGGTKVGENGLGEVFAGCEALEVLVLDGVEGTRLLWIGRLEVRTMELTDAATRCIQAASPARRGRTSPPSLNRFTPSHFFISSPALTSPGSLTTSRHSPRSSLPRADPASSASSSLAKSVPTHLSQALTTSHPTRSTRCSTRTSGHSAPRVPRSRRSARTARGGS